MAENIYPESVKKALGTTKNSEEDETSVEIK